MPDFDRPETARSFSFPRLLTRKGGKDSNIRFPKDPTRPTDDVDLTNPVARPELPRNKSFSSLFSGRGKANAAARSTEPVSSSTIVRSPTGSVRPARSFTGGMRARAESFGSLSLLRSNSSPSARSVKFPDISWPVVPPTAGRTDFLGATPPKTNALAITSVPPVPEIPGHYFILKSLPTCDRSSSEYSQSSGPSRSPSIMSFDDGPAIVERKGVSNASDDGDQVEEPAVRPRYIPGHRRKAHSGLTGATSVRFPLIPAGSSTSTSAPASEETALGFAKSRNGTTVESYDADGSERKAPNSHLGPDVMTITSKDDASKRLADGIDDYAGRLCALDPYFTADEHNEQKTGGVETENDVLGLEFLVRTLSALDGCFDDEQGEDIRGPLTASSPPSISGSPKSSPSATTISRRYL